MSAGEAVEPLLYPSSLTMNCHRSSALSVASVPRRRKLIGICKNAQRMSFGRQIIESLIFQREFEENVSRGQPDEESKEARHGSENAGSDQRRHDAEPAHSCPENHQQRTCPLNKEHLNPRVP